MAWLPHSIAEAALTASAGDGDLAHAWAHFQKRLNEAQRLVASQSAVT